MDIRVPDETLQLAGEIWCSYQEARAPWGPKRWERGNDGKVVVDRIITNTAVRDLAVMIHNRYPPLVNALGRTSNKPDPRVAEIKADLQALVAKL